MATPPSKETKELRDIKEKRRRKIIKTESRSSSPDSKKSRATAGSDKQNARALFFHEESQAAKRDSQEDLDLHRAACNELKRVMEEIKKLKDSGRDDVANTIEELRIHGTLQFITLKKLNRMSHFRCKKVRDATSEAKQKIDTHHLELQNLLYEAMHLQKEITKCLEFKSNDEEIDLVSVAEFYKQAPEDIAKPAVTREDTHQQTLARLDWELEQRKRLSQELKETKGSKDVILQDLKTKKEYLDSLQPKLNAILQATKPVQEYLGMPFDEVREQHRTATFLPAPLYVLYMQTTAYKDACDKSLTVSIEGDVDVARAMQGITPDLDEESDSDKEEDEKHAKKKRRRGKSGSEHDLLNSKTQQLVKKHPLSVCVTVKCKGGSTVSLALSYLVNLEIVTVKVTLEKEGSTSVSGGDLLSPDNILCCLYPGDFGDDTPNPANKFALERFGVGSFSLFVSEAGRAYHWVQGLCGRDFLRVCPAGEKTSRPQVSMSTSHVENTIKRLRRRIQARLSLQKQLAALERGSVPVSTEYQTLFPTKVSARLVQWKRSTFEDFCAHSFTQKLVQSGLATEQDVFFQGIVERGSAKMSVQTVLAPDYPVTSPLLVVCITWTTERNNLNDEHVRDMEAEVNIHYEELMKTKSHDQLLTNQIQRLLMCFDIYLETEAENAALEGPNEFAREKMCPRLTRGPGRAKPYVYNAQLGFFSQR